MDINNMSLKDIWHTIELKANEHPEYIEDLNATYSIDITGDDHGKYGLQFKNAVATVIEAGIQEADCSLIMNVDNFKKLLQGNLNSATAFMTGKIKVKGNIGLALKLESLLKKYSF